jgi:ADP-ribose pyrophosphatase YjhB (NUDIX family)
MNSKPLSDEDFKFVYSRANRLTVDLVVRTEAGMILALRTLPSWNGMWHLPGGAILYQERIEDAIQRIAQRELGVAVKPIKNLGYIEYTSEPKERGFGWSVALVFLCDKVSGELRSDEDASDVRAFTELPENTIEESKAFLNEHWPEIFPKN